MTDNGLAALTERLVEVEESKIKGECISDACDHDEDDPEHQPTGWVGCGDAAAILGERGVFLPDGLPEYVAFGHVEHGYTCGVCSWGRADQPRSLADYVEHMNAEHPTGPLLEGDAG